MVEAHIKEETFNSILKSKGWTAKEFHSRLQNRYGFKMGYTNFMELVNNHISWKLVYSLAICQLLDIEVDKLFILKSSEK